MIKLSSLYTAKSTEATRKNRKCATRGAGLRGIGCRGKYSFVYNIQIILIIIPNQCKRVELRLLCFRVYVLFTAKKLISLYNDL